MRQLKEWRCYQCHRLIAKADLAPKSVVEVKCHCGAYNVIKVSEREPIDSKQAMVV